MISSQTRIGQEETFEVSDVVGSSEPLACEADRCGPAKSSPLTSHKAS